MPYLRNIPVTRRALGPLGLLGGVGVALADEPDLPVTFEAYQTPPSTEWEQAWKLTDALIRRLEEEVQSRDGRLAVIIVNAPEQVYPNRWKALSDAMGQGYGWDPEMPNRRLVTILEEAGIPHLDTLPQFQAWAAQPEAHPLYFRYDFHWSPAGHALAAQAVESFLRESGLLESSNGN
jgi:hypothetical protein